MHSEDAIYLDQLCPKISNKSWRESLYKLTKYKCIYVVNLQIMITFIQRQKEV